jgi:hypothetical protein
MFAARVASPSGGVLSNECRHVGGAAASGLEDYAKTQAGEGRRVRTYRRAHHRSAGTADAAPKPEFRLSDYRGTGGFCNAGLPPRGPDGSKRAGDFLSPKAVELPVSIDFLKRAFTEPLLIRIAAGYEAAIRQRRPPKDFGRWPGSGRGDEQCRRDHPRLFDRGEAVVELPTVESVDALVRDLAGCKVSTLVHFTPHNAARA